MLRHGKHLNTGKCKCEAAGDMMLLYGEHCVPFAVIRKNRIKYINCPVCGMPVKSIPLRTIYNTNNTELLIKILNFLNEKRKLLHYLYSSKLPLEDTINTYMINDFLIVIHGLSDLSMPNAAKMYADMLGIYYLYLSNDEKYNFRVSLEVGSYSKIHFLSLARQWFLATNNLYLRIITDILLIRNIIVLSEELSAKELRVLYGNAYLIALDNIALIKKLGDDELKIVIDYLVDVKNLLEKAYIKSLDIKIAEMHASAIEDFAAKLSMAIENHGKLVREGLIRASESIQYLGDRIESGLKYHGDRVKEGLNAVASSVQVASARIAQAINRASAQIGKSVFRSALASGLLIGGSMIARNFITPGTLSQISSTIFSSTQPIFSIATSR